MFVCTRCSWCKIDIQIYLIRCRRCRRRRHRRHRRSRLPKSVAIALKPIRTWVVAIYCGCYVCVCVWIRFRSMDVQMVVLMHIALCHLLGWHCQLYPIYTAFLCLSACICVCIHFGMPSISENEHWLSILNILYCVERWNFLLQTQCICPIRIHSCVERYRDTYTHTHIAVCILNIGFTWFYLNASNEFSMSNANEIEIYCLRFESAFAMMRCIVLHTVIIHKYIHSYI